MEANELFIPEFGDKDPMRVAMEFQKAIAGADPEVGDRIAAFGSEVLSEVEKIDGEKKLTIQTLRVYVTDQPLAEDNQVHGEMIYGDGDNLLSFIFGGFQYLRTDTFRGFCLAMDEPFI